MLLSPTGGIEAAVQFITVLLIFVLVLVITLFVTKWVAGFQKTQMAGSNVTVIETTKISPNQYVQIVKIGQQYLAIAVSKEQVTVLTKLDEQELNLEKQSNAPTDFSEVLNKFRKSLPEKDSESGDDFSKNEEK